MARQLRLEFPGAIWHVTSRGNEKRPIYRDDWDRTRFLDLLEDAVSLQQWTLHAWVLMESHYHLLLETPQVPSLSLGMKRLNERYAAWFNRRHDRVGHLFQGRFKGILVERESHLLELMRYVVLNPVRCGAVRYAGDWPWSNYRATAGLRAPEPWLEIDWTLAQFDLHDQLRAQTEYRRFVADGRGAAYAPWEDLVGQVYLGGTEFCERMQELVCAKPRSREFPRAQREPVHSDSGTIISAILAETGEPETALRRKSRSPARKLFASLAWTHGGLSKTTIAGLLGASVQAVSRMVASADEARHDPAFHNLIEAVRRRLKLKIEV